MIRERVSTRGIIRPLEDEDDLPALQVPFEELGMIKELPAKRYLTGQGLWDKKYQSVFFPTYSLLLAVLCTL
jgi:hypothetical protein